MERLRLALCQIDAVVGDIAGNVSKVLTSLREAEAAGCELAIFPELVITGYPPEDLLHSPSFVAENVRALEKLALETKGCAAVVGFVEGSDVLHNSAAVLSGGEIQGIWRKELLPNYGVFDERRWFEPGTGDETLYDIGGVCVGVSICEDAWSPTGPVVRQGQSGADLVVVLNASPYRVDVLSERTAMLADRARLADAALAYVNLVGAQDELIFDGASMVFDATGKLICSAAQFEPSVTVVDLDATNAFPKRKGRTAKVKEVVTTKNDRAQTDVIAPRLTERMDLDAEVYAALVSATRGYVAKNNFKDVAIGLSGGIDSSLVAAIAVDALGAEHVHGVSMPSRFSASSSEEDARILAKNLAIDYRVITIEQAHAAFLDLLAPSFGDRASDLTEENLQARVRGTLLMALSNKFGWLVLTTGNKSETAVGYSTMYGDSAGGFAVIKDVPKTLVYRLCRLRNEQAGFDLVPSAVLEKPPTAELRPDQRDDDTLPPYEVLDPILEGYVERDLSIPELVAEGADEAVARRIVDLVDHAEYKRRQAPLGPRVTSRGFGKDRRMPITNHYRASSSSNAVVAKR